ncbi:MAG TPA: 2-oxo acid dehydrogenase subunit E2 [Bacillota bacterium]|nr:2-oxo acid dehydrogenase subunit E2 [Bacillota bacterium]HUM56019.1 2-oxo acid dehydrogenase subunit E2 [Bacillota bacterium]
MTKTKKRWGDRKDGTRLREIDGLHQTMAHLLPNRCDAEIFIKETMDVTNIIRYIEEKKAEDPASRLKTFHIFVAAIAKTVYHRELLNRFVAGRRFYQRNVVSLAFVVRRSFNDESEESLLVLKANGETELNDISRKITGDVKEIKEGEKGDIDKVLDFFARLPRPMQMLVVKLARILDFFGKMPEAITSGDTNYASVLLSNIGSIKCGAPYHHLNNYGTNSIMITIGEIHKEQVPDKDGVPVIRDVVDFGITLDERIADGFYFARSVRLLKHIIENPVLLEEPLREVVEYEG